MHVPDLIKVLCFNFPHLSSSSCLYWFISFFYSRLLCLSVSLYAHVFLFYLRLFSIFILSYSIFCFLSLIFSFH